MLKVRKSSLSEELRINARGALETTNQNVTSNGIIKLWDPKAEPHSVRDIIRIVEEGKRVKNLQYAKCLEVQVSDVGLQDHATVGNHVLGMLLACGSASDAQQVFNNLSYRDEHSWTSLMLEYIKSGQSKHAFRLYQRMQDDHVICSSFTLMALLKACVRTKDVDKGREAHAKIKEKGLENDIFVGSTLVDMYVKCGSLAEAQDVFDKLPARNVVSWTALINGYAEHGFGHEALRRFQEMLRDGVSPNPITLICSLKACGSIGAIDKGREIHSRIAERGLERDISVVTSLIDMYIKCNSSLEAQKAFDKLPVQNVVSWTTLIKGYVEHGFEQDALKCFEKMQLEGIHPNAFTFLSGLKACNNLGAITNGRELHAEIAQRGLAGDPFIGNALVDMYTGFGLFAEAENIFDNLLVQDVVSWTTLIGGYAEAGFALEALKCFEQMQSEGILPNAVTYVCSLKACGCIGAIDRARKIHNDIAQGGLEKDPFVGSSLVDFYAKHGSLAEAREIFDKLPFRNATVWNSLIARHSENGLDLHALKFFEDMQAENICPNPVTFVCILKACGNMRAGERGQEIHASITQMGLERDLFVGNALIDMYAKCGLLMSAMHVFDSMPVRDVVSWNALISGHSECGLFKEAIQCFEHMHLEGIPLTISTFVSALQACKHLGVVKKVQEIHNEAAKEGFESNPFLGNALIDIYACYGLFEKAQEVFNKLPAQDALSWSALIAGYAENGFSVEALQCFEKMKSSGMSPNAIAFVYGLKACGSLRHAYGGKVLHALIIQRNFHGNPVLGNALIDMYTKCSLLLEAQDVFGRMPVHDIITWTAIFAGRIEQDPGVDIPKYVEFMQLEGANLDTIAFISCLKACANTGFVHNVQHIHKEIVRKGFGKDLFIGTTLIDVYGKLGAILEAEEVFNKLPVRNVVSWNAIIEAFTENECAVEALKYLEQMQRNGLSPDAITFIICLRACGSIGAIHRGRELHKLILLKGFGGNIGNGLIDMYAKCGSLPEAREVFDKLPCRNLMSWTTMINGYGSNNDGNMAVQCFEDMQEDGIKPDAITFICLLTACSRCSLIIEAHKYFKIMTEKYKIMPAMDHYICMIDLLARSGLLCQAELLLETTPCSSSAEACIALLSACRSHGETEVALRCFQRLVQMNQQDAAISEISTPLPQLQLPKNSLHMT